MKIQLSLMHDKSWMKGPTPALFVGISIALMAAPSLNGQAYAQSSNSTVNQQPQTDDDRTEEPQAEEPKAEEPKPDPEFTALSKELEPLILGGWGKISALGSAAVNDQALVAAFASCRRTSRISSAKYVGNAEKTVPEADQRRGNVVYYKTKKGLQRLDTALRTVVLITRIAKRKDRGGKRQLWVLGTNKGRVAVAFGTMSRNGRRMPIMVEQNSVLLRCPQRPQE